MPYTSTRPCTTANRTLKNYVAIIPVTEFRRCHRFVYIYLPIGSLICALLHCCASNRLSIRWPRNARILDDYNREGLGIEVDQSLPSARVIRTLEGIIEWRGKPAAIRCDNGPEYVSQRLVDWANDHQITLMYIQPGKPTENAYIERFNRTVRHEWLDLHLFESIEHAQHLATEWLWKYNNERPNSAIGGVPPRQLLQAA